MLKIWKITKQGKLAFNPTPAELESYSRVSFMHWPCILDAWRWACQSVHTCHSTCPPHPWVSTWSRCWWSLRHPWTGSSLSQSAKAKKHTVAGYSWFSTQRASNTESVSMSWRQNDMRLVLHEWYQISPVYFHCGPDFIGHQIMWIPTKDLRKLRMLRMKEIKDHSQLGLELRTKQLSIYHVHANCWSLEN